MRECNCNEFADRLFELLDSEVDYDVAATLNAHLAGCPDCMHAAEAETHIRSIVRRSCQEAAPDELRMKVYAQLTVLRLGGSSLPHNPA